MPNKKIRILAPYYTTQADISSFMYIKKNWIIKKLNAIQNGQFQKIQPIAWGHIQYFLGKEYILHFQQNIYVKRPKWIMQSHTSHNILIYENNTEPQSLRQTLIKFYKKQSLQLHHDLVNCYDQFTRIYSIPKPTLRIKWMKKSWGRMNNKANMTLNVQLIKLDTPYRYYVILHELSHLIQFNHSRAFYEILQSVCPDAKNYQKKLSFFPLDQ